MCIYPYKNCTNPYWWYFALKEVSVLSFSWHRVNKYTDIHANGMRTLSSFELFTLNKFFRYNVCICIYNDDDDEEKRIKSCGNSGWCNFLLNTWLLECSKHWGEFNKVESMSRGKNLNFSHTLTEGSLESTFQTWSVKRIHVNAKIIVLSLSYWSESCKMGCFVVVDCYLHAYL